MGNGGIIALRRKGETGGRGAREKGMTVPPGMSPADRNRALTGAPGVLTQPAAAGGRRQAMPPRQDLALDHTSSAICLPILGRRYCPPPGTRRKPPRNPHSPRSPPPAHPRPALSAPTARPALAGPDQGTRRRSLPPSAAAGPSVRPRPSGSRSCPPVSAGNSPPSHRPEDHHRLSNIAWEGEQTAD